jgi:hypothetical protein
VQSLVRFVQLVRGEVENVNVWWTCTSENGQSDNLTYSFNSGEQ